jgi:hypothetical protein
MADFNIPEGNNSFHNLIKSMQGIHDKFNIPGLDALAKASNLVNKELNNYSAISNSNWQHLVNSDIYKASQIGSFDLASSLNNSLAAIYTINPDITSRLKEFASSQSAIGSVLSSISKMNINSSLNIFDNIINEVATLNIDGFTETEKWEDIIVIKEEKKEDKENIEDKVIRLTTEQLNDFKQVIVKELENKLTEESSKKIKTFNIDRLLSLISLLLAFYSLVGPSNQEIINNTNRRFDKINTKLNVVNQKEDSLLFLVKDIKSKIELIHTRQAKTFVNLRKSTNTKSKVIGLVNKGQIVVVTDIKKKWLFVKYIDDETGEKREGYVFKKYFKKNL